jgi:hypothetical protein
LGHYDFLYENKERQMVERHDVVIWTSIGVLLALNGIAVYYFQEILAVQKSNSQIETVVQKYLTGKSLDKAARADDMCATYTVFNNITMYEKLDIEKDMVKGEHILLIDKNVLDANLLIEDIMSFRTTHIYFGKTLMEIVMNGNNKAVTTAKLRDGPEIYHVIGLQPLNKGNVRHFNRLRIDYPDVLRIDEIITILGFGTLQ